LRLKYEPSVSQVIEKLLAPIHRGHWSEVVFCGFGEPTSRLDCILQVTKWIKELHNLWVRVDTNGHGYLLNPAREVVTELEEAGVDEVSVSLNGQNEEAYNKVCRPVFAHAYEGVLEFIWKAKESLDMEITAVRIPEIDVSDIERQASQLGVRFRPREYVPCFY